MDNLINMFITDPSGVKLDGFIFLEEEFKVSTNLSRFIKKERVKQGLNYAEVSKMMGYKNINKGMRRIIELEREGLVHSEVLEKIIETLNLDRDHIDSLILKDRREYEEEFGKWLSEPIEPYYTLRIMPSIYLSYDLPGNLSTEKEAAEYVAKIAKRKKVKAWVNLSRRERIYITEKGEIRGKIKTTIENANYPYTRFK